LAAKGSEAVRDRLAIFNKVYDYNLAIALVDLICDHGFTRGKTSISILLEGIKTLKTIALSKTTAQFNLNVRLIDSVTEFVTTQGKKLLYC
jgi:hypothetical protein